MTTINQMQPAIEALRSGQLVLLLDDMRSQSIAYFVAGAESITAEAICFALEHGAAVICAALPESKLQQLGLPDMQSHGRSGAISFSVSIEARQGVTTGISAADRACTLRTLASSNDARLDLVSPGHIFPLPARNGGVLVKHGAAEAAVDLLKLSNLNPVAMIAHCLGSTGDFCAEQDATGMAVEQGLPVVRLSEIIQFRLAREPIVEKISSARIPIANIGSFQATVYRSTIDNSEHIALTCGEVSQDQTQNDEPVLVRVHSEHRVSDLLDVGPMHGRRSVVASLQEIGSRGRGVFLYIRHPRTGTITEQVAQMTNADDQQRARPRRDLSALRQLGIGAQILQSLGVRSIVLLSNSNRPVIGVEAFGLEIVSREPLTLRDLNQSTVEPTQLNHQTTG